MERIESIRAVLHKQYMTRAALISAAGTAYVTIAPSSLSLKQRKLYFKSYTGEEENPLRNITGPTAT